MIEDGLLVSKSLEKRIVEIIDEMEKEHPGWSCKFVFRKGIDGILMWSTELEDFEWINHFGVRGKNERFYTQ